ncbi:hypothetical protein O6H91_14G028400 [Diphasiastrum complanatum]|uniref:Uncharacterized protein n=2 Tax=Diphasiastrum complanatum TaxID=34168 RepID=A0ACC2BMT3_DIPCM|nr:hypothetical protein O6H91_14G028400 [Diphasiastrum complanatum]KAJ7531009.1 hypothetical protein O6H91_14G028400 [Diphasiastrum complanatum]
MAENNNNIKLKTQQEEVEQLCKLDGAKSEGEMPFISGSSSLKVDAHSPVSEVIAEKEIDFLIKRVKTAETLLDYLKSKAKIMSIPRYAFISCGIKVREGVGLVDRRGIPMMEWPTTQASSAPCGTFGLDRVEEDPLYSLEKNILDSAFSGDGSYVERIAVAVMQVTDVMELLLKRALVAEAKFDVEREKVKASQQDVKQKSVQVESMWARVEEMEKVALNTSGALKEMQRKLKDMEVETSRQRHRANENEQELSRVRHDFSLLRLSLDSLIKARETIQSMETRIEEAETTSKRLSNQVVSLEVERLKSKNEIAKLLLENDTLRAGFDFREAELAALGDEVKKFFSQTESRCFSPTQMENGGMTRLHSSQ